MALGSTFTKIATRVRFLKANVRLINNPVGKGRVSQVTRAKARSRVSSLYLLTFFYIASLEVF